VSLPRHRALPVGSVPLPRTESGCWRGSSPRPWCKADCDRCTRRAVPAEQG